MKIILAGTPDFAVPSLQKLVKHHSVVAVVTGRDKPQGRGLKVKPSPVKECALAHSLCIFTDPINTLEKPLKDRHADLLVVVAYGEMINNAILRTPRLGGINVHPSLLPRLRGASPIQGAILNADLQTGVTIMEITERLDAGPIITQESTPLLGTETAGLLHDTLSVLGADLLIKTIPHLEEITRNQQSESDATYSPKVSPQNAEISHHESALLIERKIRAYNPWPCAYLKIGSIFGNLALKKIDPLKSGKTKEPLDKQTNIKTLKIFKGEIKPSPHITRLTSLIKKTLRSEVSGDLVVFEDKPALLCSDRRLIVFTEVQPEGKKRMSGEAFVRGYLKK